MKIKSYQVRRINKRSHVFSGNLLELDDKAGIKDTLQREIEAGQKIIVLNLRGLRILNEEVFLAIVHINNEIKKFKGQFIISEAPDFIPWIFQLADILDDFVFVRDESNLDRIFSYSKILINSDKNDILKKSLDKRLNTVFG